MRRSLAVAIWCASAAAFAQEPTRAPTPVPTPAIGPLQFQEVVTVEGATKAQLYDAALLWFPSAFRSGKDVLQIQNKEAGMLVGTGEEPYTFEQKMLWVSMFLTGKIVYRVTIEAKDGRYRFTADGFTHDSTTRGRIYAFGALTTDARPPATTGSSLTENQRAKMWRDINARAASIAAELAKSLRAKLSTAATEKPW